MMEACTERLFCRKAWRSERGKLEYKSRLGLVRGLSLLAPVSVDVAVESCARRVRGLAWEGSDEGLGSGGWPDGRKEADTARMVGGGTDEGAAPGDANGKAARMDPGSPPLLVTLLSPAVRDRKDPMTFGTAVRARPIMRRAARRNPSPPHKAADQANALSHKNASVVRTSLLPSIHASSFVLGNVSIIRPPMSGPSVCPPAQTVVQTDATTSSVSTADQPNVVWKRAWNKGTKGRKIKVSHMPSTARDPPITPNACRRVGRWVSSGGMGPRVSMAKDQRMVPLKMAFHSPTRNASSAAKKEKMT
jgi:hypothetical protein